MKTISSVILKDSKDIRNVVIQVDFKNNRTSVFSGFSAWDNLAYIMEGLAVTAEQCIRKGIPKKQVYQEIADYLVRALGEYQIVKEKRRV